MAKHESTPQRGKFKKLILICIIIFGGWWYWNNVRMPGGVDTPNQVLKYTSTKSVKSMISFYANFHNNELYDNTIFVLKNDKTNRYVFKVIDNKTNKIHYCYLIRIGIDPPFIYAVDMNDKSYMRSVTRIKYHSKEYGSAASVYGHVKYSLVDGISIMEYNEKISSLD